MIEVRIDFDAFITYDFVPSIFHLHLRSPETGYEDFDKITALVQQQWTNIQQRSIKHLDELKKAKILVHDAKWIREGFKAIIVFLAEQSLHSADEQKYFESCECIVEHTLSLWKKSGLPNTLVHGDLHRGNIAQPDGPGSSLVFFDWESAYIGFPFLDVGDELSLGWGSILKNVDAYLECWTSYACLKIVEELVVFTRPIMFLVFAISQMKDESLTTEGREMIVMGTAESFIESVKEFKNCRSAAL